MKVKQLTLAVMAVPSVICTGAMAANQPVSAQAAVASEQQVQIHEDLQKCYASLGRMAEQEAEYRWLTTARPGKAIYQFNYAVLLKSENKTAAAAPHYEKAATVEPSNVDYVGQCGLVYAQLKNYQKAYQYLGRAIQTPGGERYKGSFDAVQQYLMQLQQQKQMNAVPKKSGGGASGTTTKRRDDDDDD